MSLSMTLSGPMTLNAFSARLQLTSASCDFNSRLRRACNSSISCALVRFQSPGRDSCRTAADLVVRNGSRAPSLLAHIIDIGLWLRGESVSRASRGSGRYSLWGQNWLLHWAERAAATQSHAEIQLRVEIG